MALHLCTDVRDACTVPHPAHLLFTTKTLTHVAPPHARLRSFSVASSLYSPFLDHTEGKSCLHHACPLFVLQVNQKLSLMQAGNLEEDLQPGELQRSPSPEPIYNEHGARINTREARAKEKLVKQRNELITAMVKANPSYRQGTGPRSQSAPQIVGKLSPKLHTTLLFYAR